MRLGMTVRLWEKPAMRVSAFGDVIKVWVWALGLLFAERLFSKSAHAVATVPTGFVAMLGVFAVGGFVNLITKDYGKRENAD